MHLDLNDLLRDWPYEPGMIEVRKILGADGKEKIQLRIDLGLIQMETTGRPDGQKPHDCESLLDYHKERARRAEKKGAALSLSSDEVGELQQEGVQYYHRYISFFQLCDYRSVIRDTQRNLDMFAFVAKHAEREALAQSVDQFTPYVLMMNTRAHASIEIEREEFATAVRKIDEGMDRISAFYAERGNPEGAANCAELGFLEQMKNASWQRVTRRESGRH
jgi:hypothetical protein